MRIGKNGKKWTLTRSRSNCFWSKVSFSSVLKSGSRRGNASTSTQVALARTSGLATYNKEITCQSYYQRERERERVVYINNSFYIVFCHAMQCYFQQHEEEGFFKLIPNTQCISILITCTEYIWCKYGYYSLHKSPGGYTHTQGHTHSP